MAISFYYPPANNPRAVQVARLLRHTKLSTTLVCAAYVDNTDRRDELLVAESEGLLKSINRIPFEQSMLRRRITGLVSRAVKPVWDEWPDGSRSWKNMVVPFVSDLIQHHGYRPDAMITFGSPMSDHLIGLELKKLYNL